MLMGICSSQTVTKLHKSFIYYYLFIQAKFIDFPQIIASIISKLPIHNLQNDSLFAPDSIVIQPIFL